MSLAHLDPELRDVFGLVLTKWRGMTVPLLDSIFEDAVRGVSFQSTNNKMTTLQNNAFNEKRTFQAQHNDKMAQGTLHGKVTKEKCESAMCLDLKDVMTQPFPSR